MKAKYNIVRFDFIDDGYGHLYGHNDMMLKYSTIAGWDDHLTAGSLKTDLVFLRKKIGRNLLRHSTVFGEE